MNRKLFRQLEQQFGGNWSCSCQTPFDLERFEILSETESSILAHYACPTCNKEQMIAAAVGGAVASTLQTDLLAHEAKKFLRGEFISSDDVLDLRGEIRKMDFRKLKSLVKESQISEQEIEVGALLSFPTD
ncbi:MAG: hypothetical protein A3F33_00425 [Candidatus Woykebacteria bacterium RIFCSPHIGHO2_12_FULL_43_10]|uniref:Uncharacterized protein n=2 Tax=Candidatus Woykeibacteriota TaxID=1817899 RepID=A0A1G1WZ38_9BACT|nr:MAG: hypothetical protein A3J50_02110 [Candidatus Woykebacteria bacterium RIFCSPHIGHO2_02_FULL_43_16b]OGY28878.1 MAG: hypothetical protein A3F33_00425 [Candidatus Woykebacteria bacterium RIFCSPHIGHO2_12_FULL_43_10]OGY32600.1 MAG: hypothetical protein A3A61_03750 [Candidatus Woykebacteria bacterium RIFCSPLOWO2_01_FULL_43_14]